MKHLSNSATATLLSKSQEVHFYECIHHLLGLCSQGLAPNPTKVKAILDWHDPATDTEVRSFHGLSYFYRRFLQNFSSIMAPITDCTKKRKFQWSSATNHAFEKIKCTMTEAPILCLPNFEKVSEVACNASNGGIGTVLSHEGHPIAF